MIPVPKTICKYSARCVTIFGKDCPNVLWMDDKVVCTIFNNKNGKPKTLRRVGTWFSSYRCQECRNATENDNS